MKIVLKKARNNYPGIDPFVTISLALVFLPGLFLLFLTGVQGTSQAYTPLYCFYFIFLFANVCAIPIFYLFHLRAEKNKLASWQILTKANGLSFVPGPFERGGIRIAGNYRDHHLRLETTRKSDTNTRIVLSPKHIANLPTSRQVADTANDQILAEEVITLFDRAGQGSKLKGQIKTTANNTVLTYEQVGFEKDAQYLQRLFDLLSDLADTYPKVMILGGKIISALQAIAINRKHILQQVVIQWLQDIEQETTNRIRDQASHMICPICLTCCTAYEIALNRRKRIKYYGCRKCSQSREFFTGKVIAVLDNTMIAEKYQSDDSTLRVNWLIRRGLFDFDEIEIVRATDEEVERFAVQVGNDTDPIRQRRYKGMQYKVLRDSYLSENTLKILQRMFG